MFRKFTAILFATMLIFCVSACQVEENVAEDTENVQNDSLEQENSLEYQEITDMIGRTVSVPSEIEKVYCTQPVGAIFLYHVNPDKLLGWNYEPTDDEKVLLLEEYHDLDTFGMGGSTNYEAIIEANPQVCIVTFEENGESLQSEIENLELMLNIPVLAVNSSIYEASDAYRFLGELLGEQEQAEKLAIYAENIFNSIVEVPESEQKSLYFGNGTDSLETSPVGSISAQEFELLHIKNVAEVTTSQSNRVNISMEQILEWNPEIIIVNGEPSEDLSEEQAVLDILNDTVYANVTAVINGEVYGVPKSPFSFISRPMGPNRLMGIQWLKCVVYPEYYDLEIENVAKEFYSLFYHIDLTDEQVSKLLY